jgi:hypothetical protein
MNLKDLKFEVGDAVTIEPFSTKGIVVGIYIGPIIEFHVRYFMNSDVKTTYFRAEELTKR